MTSRRCPLPLLRGSQGSHCEDGAQTLRAPAPGPRGLPVALDFSVVWVSSHFPPAIDAAALADLKCRARMAARRLHFSGWWDPDALALGAVAAIQTEPHVKECLRYFWLWARREATEALQKSFANKA
mmetsp:Transcript_94420/g.281823  ORF Transcript_94420/g.281823 Transcript_94420/m.281823 type:complete len:127 (+) Transcript_94420:522-902(+)